jgi:LmbE family N-acetylglucosaminyl deacetylase
MHHGGDLNVDHRVVHAAVVTAFRPLAGATVRKILAFETLSSTEWASSAVGLAFRPNHFVGIDRQLDRKLAALGAYAEEMRPFPHPRSAEAVRALAVLRGSSAGLAAAEAFMTIRHIER